MSEYLTYKQVAEELDIPYRLVQRYVAQGRLGQRLPSGYIITRQDLEEFKKIPRPVGRPRKQVKAAE